MHSLVAMQWTIYYLSAAQWIAIAGAVASGFTTRYAQTYREKLLFVHRCFVWAIWAVTLMIIGVVEGVIVPNLHRYYYPLVWIHLTCCAIFTLSLCATCWFNGKRLSLRFPLRHRFLGLLTLSSATAMAILGDIIASRLRP